MTTNDTFPKSKWRILFWIAFALSLGSGLAVRLYHITEAPLDFNPTRQLHSALIARGMYYEHLSAAPIWQRQLAVKQWINEGLIEPQIMERLSAWGYQLTGGVNLWIPRLLAILFWMLGGVGIFLIGRELTSSTGGLIAMLFYLFLPFGIVASRAFQPESLSEASIIFAVWAVYCWYRRHTWRWTVVAGLLCGLSIYIKSNAVFFIGGVLLVLVLGGLGIVKAVRERKVWVLGILAVLPYAVYLFYGTSILHLLEGQFKLRFFPEMWLDPAWYIRWMGAAKGVVGFGSVLLGLIGILLFTQKPQRLLMIGFWLGYVALGFTFPYHIYSHDYYQEPLIAIVALSLAPVAEALIQRLGILSAGRLGYIAFVGVIAAGVALNAWDGFVSIKKVNYRNDIIFWTEMGDLLGHEHKVIGLVQNYGFNLAYWGWIDTTTWPYQSDLAVRDMAGDSLDLVKWFDKQIVGKDFFVVTMFNEFNSQPQIVGLLNANYPVYRQTADYLIYDLLHPKTPQPAP